MKISIKNLKKLIIENVNASSSNQLLKDLEDSFLLNQYGVISKDMINKGTYNYDNELINMSPSFFNSLKLNDADLIVEPQISPNRNFDNSDITAFRAIARQLERKHGQELVVVATSKSQRANKPVTKKIVANDPNFNIPIDRIFIFIGQKPDPSVSTKLVNISDRDNTEYTHYIGRN